MTNDVWADVLNTLKGAIGKSNFSNWIEPLEFAHVSDGVAIFEVPTNFIGNYVSQHFGDQILYHLKKSGQDVQRLSFRVPAKQAKATKPRQK